MYAIKRSMEVFRASQIAGWVMYAVAAFLIAASCVAAAQSAQRWEPSGVAHIALRVSDVDAEVQFLNKLGFEQAFVHEQNGKTAFVFVKVNDQEFFEVHPRTPLNGKAPLSLGFNHICFLTADANTAHAQWAKAGLNPTEAAKGPDGTSEFGAKDPSGALTEALEILPGSQPDMDKGKHLGPNRVSESLIGIDIPAADIAAWRKFYEGIGFTGVEHGGVVQLSSPAKPQLRVVLHTAGKVDQTSIFMAAADLDRAADQLGGKGLSFERAADRLNIHDPDGNTFVLLRESGPEAANAMVRPFGRTTDGIPTDIYTLKSRNGFEAQITNYGATVVSLKTPDRKGNLADVVLGFDDLDGYIRGKDYFGATIGRFGNRIANGTFSLNGETYHLATNNGNNHLHGGIKGFDRVVWTARPISPESIEFSYTSKDGEENYPGTLDVKVTFTVTVKNELKIDYAAKEAPGEDTIVNLTNHSYFNLTGDEKNSILQHQIMLKASRFTPTDAGQIPTGEIRPVKGTPFDFTRPTAIGARIDQNDEQLKMGKGYDHNWIIDRKDQGLVLAAELYDPQSGRVMQVLTTEPGIQFYSGNFLDGSEKGKGGQSYGFRSGLALETQHYPDSPNHPNFPSTTLRAGQSYSSTTIYRFSAR